jgi:molybdopterin-binding protein
MKISARNMLNGKVKQIKPGTLNTEAIIELTSGGQVAYVITKKSVKNLESAVGEQVYVVIKASNVMIAVD